MYHIPLLSREGVSVAIMEKQIDLVRLRKEYKRAFYRVNGREILSQIGKGVFHISDYPLEQVKDYLCYIKKIEEDDYRSDIHDVIKNTDIYKRLNNLYVSYINQNLSEFVKSQGLRSTIDVTIFYQYLLDLGVLSYPGTYQYDFDGLRALYQVNEVLDTLGARVASGMAVCRHTSFHLMNLHQSIGNDVAVLSLITIPDFNRDFFDEYKKALYTVNHAINIIFSEEGVYGYCSTTRSFYNILEKDNVLLYLPVIHSRNLHIPWSMNLNTITPDALTNKKIRKKYICADYQRYQDISSMNSYNQKLSKLRFMSLLSKDINSKDTRILNGKELDKRQNKIAHQVVDNLDEIRSFHEKTLPTLYKIDKLYNRIAPLTKQKVKSLRIR